MTLLKLRLHCSKRVDFIRLLHGRTFTAQDEQGGPPLAIVNETLARQSFPGEDPLGRRIKPSIAFGESDDAPMREIVGVIADTAELPVAAIKQIAVPKTKIRRHQRVRAYKIIFADKPAQFRGIIMFAFDNP